MKSILICLIGLVFYSSGKIVSIRKPQPLRIASLPRQPYQNSFDMYSGYLKAGKGNKLFYWLVNNYITLSLYINWKVF